MKNKSLEEHYIEFERDGFTLFPKMLSQEWMNEMKGSFDELSKKMHVSGQGDPNVLTNVLEHKHDYVLPALTNEKLLDFVEMIVGPHVQLESTTFRRTPPQQKKENHVLGYHRDMFASFPQEGVYQRPLLFNALSYLQDLNDENGPLRIIPGSHKQALSISPKEMNIAREGDRILYPKAGDIAVFHCSLLHTGCLNLSNEYRYLYFMTLNHSWLKHRENFDGPVCRDIIKKARQNNDRRLLRLLGQDDQFVGRANCGFQSPEEDTWKRWIEEDKGALKT